MGKRSKIVLLGATGSIGSSSLKVIRKHSDRLELVGIAANRNVDQLAAIAKEFGVPEVCLFDSGAWKQAEDTNAFPASVNLTCGEEGLCYLASLPNCDTVLIAIVGTRGLMPALAALEAGHTLAVASKEILVLAGKLIVEAARKSKVEILPVDSEHNALFNAFKGFDPVTFQN